MDSDSSSTESSDGCARPGTFGSCVRRVCSGKPDAKDHPVNSERASGAQQHGEGRTETAGFETRQMRPACLEMNGTFRLRHPPLETQATHDAPESARACFRTVLFVQVSRREGESCVPDAKRSSASLADRGEGRELYETACGAADGIKANIRIHEVLLWCVPHSCVALIAGHAGAGDKSALDAAECCGLGEVVRGREEKGIRGEREARRDRGLGPADVRSEPMVGQGQLMREGGVRGEGLYELIRQTYGWSASTSRSGYSCFWQSVSRRRVAA